MTYLTRIILQVIIVGEGEGGVIGVTPPFPPLNMKKKINKYNETTQKRNRETVTYVSTFEYEKNIYIMKQRKNRTEKRLHNVYLR